MVQEYTQDQWKDWKWQLANRINTLDDLRSFVEVSKEEEEGFSKTNGFRIDITPYFAKLMHPTNPNCPIRKQVIPSALESIGNEKLNIDSLHEEEDSPVRGLVHRYPDRVLMLLTTQCASYCRYCTRSRIVGKPEEMFSLNDYKEQINYIRGKPEIRDVLLSGGDPLLLSNNQIESILAQLRSIPHVEIIRIGTRVPIFLPMRIDKELCAILSKYHPLWLNMHINHPNEITSELRFACDLLCSVGIPLGNQSVLLAGINDCSNIQLALVRKLVSMRVRPYYLYQCDLVKGAGHFRTPIAKGIEIIENLRGHTSGYAIPTYVVDLPEGGGKVPVSPNYQLSQSTKTYTFRNYNNDISTYSEPESYQEHESKQCFFCDYKQK